MKLYNYKTVSTVRVSKIAKTFCEEQDESHDLILKTTNNNNNNNNGFTAI